MDFLNKIGNKITSGANVVANKTKDLAETTKINMQISQDEGKLNNLFTEIGKIYYKKHIDNPDEEVVASFKEIADIQARISAAKEQVAEIKGTMKCPSCGVDIPMNASFCGSCGAKIEPKVTVVENTQQAQSTTITCPGCGKVEDASAEFCSNCGCKLK